MTRRATAAVMMALPALLFASMVARADGREPARTAANAFGLEKPEDLVTMKGLSYPGLTTSFGAEADAGLISMVQPMVEQLIQAAPGAPGRLGDIAKGIPQGGAGMGKALAELLGGIQGVAVVVQAPQAGDVNVSKVATFYMQKAQSARWRPLLQLNQEQQGVIVAFQLPAAAQAGGTPEPPRGFAVAVVSPKQVIAAAMLGRVDLQKLLPLLMSMTTPSAPPAPPESAPPADEGAEPTEPSE